MICQYLRLRGEYAGVIHRCRLLEWRYPAMAAGASRVSGILAAWRISFRRPPARLFQSVRSCQADAIRQRTLRASQAKRHYGQCHYDSRPTAAQPAPFLIPIRGVPSLLDRRYFNLQRFGRKMHIYKAARRTTESRAPVQSAPISTPISPQAARPCGSGESSLRSFQQAT